MSYFFVCILLFFISIFNLFKKDYAGFLLFIIPCLSLTISSFLSCKNTEKEKLKQQRKDLFDSLLKPTPKVFKDNYSTITTLIVPSQKFFYEMTKNEHKH